MIEYGTLLGWTGKSTLNEDPIEGTLAICTKREWKDTAVGASLIRVMWIKSDPNYRGQRDGNFYARNFKPYKISSRWISQPPLESQPGFIPRFEAVAGEIGEDDEEQEKED